MERREDRLFTIADRQQGYFTASQAVDCGYYSSHFHRQLEAGEWLHSGRGLYRLARYPITDRPDLMEWSLWSRNKKGEVQGVWSHETALDLYEVCDVMPAKLHMTVPKSFRRSITPPSHLKLYFKNLKPNDWVEKEGYRLTSCVRTLVDLAETGQLSSGLLKQAVVGACKKGLFTDHQRDALPNDQAGLLIQRYYDEQ